MVFSISAGNIIKYWAKHSFCILFFSNDKDEYCKAIESWLEILNNGWTTVKCMKVEWSDFESTYSEHKNICKPYDVVMMGCQKIIDIISDPTFGVLEHFFSLVYRCNRIDFKDIMNVKPQSCSIKYLSLQKQFEKELSETKSKIFRTLCMKKLDTEVNIKATDLQSQKYLSEDSNYRYGKPKVKTYVTTINNFKNPNEFRIFMDRNGKKETIEATKPKSRVLKTVKSSILSKPLNQPEPELKQNSDNLEQKLNTKTIKAAKNMSKSGVVKKRSYKRKGI